MNQEIELKHRYNVIYRISGDSGVEGKGNFLLSTDDISEYDKLSENLASMNDDRCMAYIVWSDIPMEQVNAYRRFHKGVEQ